MNIAPDWLIEHLRDSDDPLLRLREIQPSLTTPAFTQVCEMLDVCSVHLVDWEICRDDEAECPAGGMIREYCVGLPVVVTVYRDGRVELDVDYSEASDLWEGAPTDQFSAPLYTDAQVEADIALVQAAIVRTPNADKVVL